MSVDTTDHCPVDLLGSPHARDYLLDNMYIESLCVWVLDHPEQAEYVQDRLRCNIEALTIEGYDILWQRLGQMYGWKDLVWEGVGNRAHPVYDCEALLRKTAGVMAVQEMYLFLHGKLSGRARSAALKFSEQAAVNAASWAIAGIWKGASLLMEAIIDKESQTDFLVAGKYSWWEAAAKTLASMMEKGTNLMGSGILDQPTLKYVKLLERGGVGARNDPAEVGITFVKACLVCDGYIPLLWGWMNAGGNWQGAWDQCGQLGQQIMERHPAVRRSRLMEIARIPLPSQPQEYNREM